MELGSEIRFSDEASGGVRQEADRPMSYRVGPPGPKSGGKEVTLWVG